MDQKAIERKNNIQLSREDYERETLHPNYLHKCSKEELIQIIQKQTALSHKDTRKLEKATKALKNAKQMNFAEYELAKFALKFTYIGANYAGLVVQANEPNTVEQHLLSTLRKVCLIDPNDSSSYACCLNRCGRTDKGVSALNNVLSIVMRKLPQEDYILRINRCLPQDIRVLAYAYVDESFDSRFSCVYREYNYFFFQQQMNIPLLAKSALKLLGLHDFRNFAKKDDTVFRPDDEEQNFMRRIYLFRTQLVQRNSVNPGLNVYKCVIRGSAFLWHQVRLMMNVLFMIGRGDEPPEIIDTLLDVEKVPTRPEYDYAAGENLILSDCGFEDMQWRDSVYSSNETYLLFKVSPRE